MPFIPKSQVLYPTNIDIENPTRITYFVESEMSTNVYPSIRSLNLQVAARGQLIEALQDH